MARTMSWGLLGSRPVAASAWATQAVGSLESCASIRRVREAECKSRSSSEVARAPLLFGQTHHVLTALRRALAIVKWKMSLRGLHPRSHLNHRKRRAGRPRSDLQATGHVHAFSCRPFRQGGNNEDAWLSGPWQCEGKGALVVVCHMSHRSAASLREAGKHGRRVGGLVAASGGTGRGPRRESGSGACAVAVLVVAALRG